VEKSTVEEIRQRFDAEVERFSNLETGQSATIDAALALQLIAAAAARTTPQAVDILDLGCGAGNYTLQLLQHLPHRNVTLVDLSQPMLDRAQARISGVSTGTIQALQCDVRELNLPSRSCDIILAAAVLHHLRTPTEWENVFARLFEWLRPNGSAWIFDLVEHSLPAVQELMWQRYGEYLTDFRDEAYRDHVFAYIAQEDTPCPLITQLELLRLVGFSHIDVLHKNGCFAAFGAQKIVVSE